MVVLLGFEGGSRWWWLTVVEGVVEMGLAEVAAMGGERRDSGGGS